MFDKETLTALQLAETVPAVAHVLEVATDSNKGNGIAALPENFTHYDFEHVLNARRRARGVMMTADIESFSGYIANHEQDGSTVFVDADEMAATCVLNLGSPSEAGHCDNLAKLSLKKTAAFKSLLQLCASYQSQQDTAEFFEDWAGQATFFADGGEVKAGHAIAAIRKLTIESFKKLESTESQLSESKSTFESVAATSTETIPTTIYFKCEPYNGLTERTFIIRLSIITRGDNKPAVSLRIIKAEQHTEDMAHELANIIETSIAENDDINHTAVLLGVYKKTV